MSKLACGRAQIPFYRGFFKYKKDLELVSRSLFVVVFFVVLQNLTKFHYHYQTVYFPSHSRKCVPCFMLRHLVQGFPIGREFPVGRMSKFSANGVRTFSFSV